MMTRLFALAVTAAAVASTPVAAAAPVSCKATPAQIRTLAQAKAGADTNKVLSLVATGEKLCAEDAKYEAGKKFAAAAKLLGTDLASLATATSGQ